MATGTVEWFNDSKGYSSVTTYDGGSSVTTDDGGDASGR